MDDLIRNGWTPTRWEHPEDGVMEKLQNGKWRNTEPNGDFIEYGGNDGMITVHCAGGITVKASDAEGNEVIARFGAAVPK